MIKMALYYNYIMFLLDWQNYSLCVYVCALKDAASCYILQIVQNFLTFSV